MSVFEFWRTDGGVCRIMVRAQEVTDFMGEAIDLIGKAATFNYRKCRLFRC
ncbi:hypothetical protein D3C71_1794610 [compost metagenome]